MFMTKHWCFCTEEWVNFLSLECCVEYGTVVCQPGFREWHTLRNENLLQAISRRQALPTDKSFNTF